MCMGLGMPNHVTNRITINTDNALVREQILAAISSVDEKGDAVLIDFDQLLPTPEGIKETNGVVGPKANSDEAKRRAMCLRKYGFESWYDWNIANWGTKWSAYSQEKVDASTIKFDTAWSHPIPVVRALSCRFPDVEFLVEWADEDVGHNLGKYRIKSGVLEFDPETPAEGTKEARMFAYRVKGYDEDDITMYEDDHKGEE